MKKCTKCKVKIPEHGPAMCPSCIKKELECISKQKL